MEQPPETDLPSQAELEKLGEISDRYNGDLERAYAEGALSRRWISLADAKLFIFALTGFLIETEIPSK